MLHLSRWKILLVVLATVFGIVWTVPNLLPRETTDKWPAWINQRLNLGLDLQGGSYLLLEVETDAIRRETIRDEDGEEEVLYVEDVRGLVSLVQASVLEIHPWGSTIADIDRPDRMNAFRGRTCEELIHAFNRAGWDKAVGVIVLTGTGDRAFCTGGDQSAHDGNYDGRGIIGLPVEELQSMIRDDGERRILFDLDQSVQRLTADLGGTDRSVIELTGVYHNLLRRWADA